MLTAENKNELDGLLASHEMARYGKDEMALYVLHNIKPHALKLAEEPEEKDDEPSLDLGDLLRFLRS